jgi:hypothetical protein
MASLDPVPSTSTVVDTFNKKKKAVIQEVRDESDPLSVAD